MKWFKHFSHASDDEFISWVEDNFGLEGYARWWKLLEVIAKQMDSSGKCSAKYSWQKWQTFLKGKRKQLGCFLVALENQRKIKLVDSGNELEIICYKLLELRDNHTKNLQVANKLLASKEVEEEVEEEVNKIKTPYPLKNGVVKNRVIKNGRKKFCPSGLKEVDLQQAKKAAPRWDLYHLAEIYNESMGDKPAPAYPNKAFIGWCAKYTKGREP